MTWFVRLGSLVLAGVFLLAAVPKIVEPAEFVKSIRNYRITIGGREPWWGWHAVALWLPWLEAIAALCLVTGIWRRAALLVVAGLLAFFSGLGVYAIATGLDISCGCFGKSAEGAKGFLGTAKGLVAQDVPLLLLAVAVYFAQCRLERHEGSATDRRLVEPVGRAGGWA
jgi:hypothetical protein